MQSPVISLLSYLANNIDVYFLPFPLFLVAGALFIVWEHRRHKVGTVDIHGRLSCNQKIHKRF